jgi:hypothetical protein
LCDRRIVRRPTQLQPSSVDTYLLGDRKLHRAWRYRWSMHPVHQCVGRRGGFRVCVAVRLCVCVCVCACVCVYLRRACTRKCNPMYCNRDRRHATAHQRHVVAVSTIEPLGADLAVCCVNACAPACACRTVRTLMMQQRQRPRPLHGLATHTLTAALLHLVTFAVSSLWLCSF